MKNKNSLKKRFGSKNLIMSAVALILVLILGVGMTYSWIEEVSNVELNTNSDSQQTPLHISDKHLMSDIESQQPGSGVSANVDLSKYFYEGGNMHLSACYGDGDHFYFPKSGTYSSTSIDDYREGTKDDADINYISATFRVKSSGAPTSYWFERKNGTSSTIGFLNTRNYTGATDAAGERTYSNAVGSASSPSGLEQYLRASITVEGSTTVYAFNSTGAFTYFKTDNNVKTTATGALLRPVRNYMYYNETFRDTNPLGYYKNNANKGSKYNQGSGDNLDGNTLFTVPADKTVTVTVKLWLECNAQVTSVDLSDINLQLVSSWAKTRRIYIRDKTVNEYDSVVNYDGNHPNQTGEKWLTRDSNARLFLALYDNETPSEYTHYPVVAVPNTTGLYYVDIDTATSGVQDMPAVYNGAAAAFYRCNQQWNAGNNHNNDIKYWDKWEVTLPNTFHSEVYSIYSHKYGNWETVDANEITFIDSCKFQEQGFIPRAYLWDSNSVITGQTDDGGVTAKVVKNAEWPGEEMTRLGTGAGNMGLPTYKVFYSSTYDRGVFNDGLNGNRNQLQTQDVWFRNGNTSYVKDFFDMATLKWYDSTYLTNTVKFTDAVLVNNFNQNGSTWSHIRMVYYTDGTQETNNHYFMCRAFIKSAGTYKFMIYDGSRHYGKPDGWGNWGENYGATMRDINDHQYEDGYVVDINVTEQDITDSGNGVFRFFFDKDNKYFKWERGEDSR